MDHAPAEPPPTTPTPPVTSHVPTVDVTVGTGGVASGAGSVAMQDLSDDKLIHTAPRAPFNGVSVPSLGGIPLLAQLGQGGMGAVYYGIHPRLRQEVAVKVLPFEMAEKNPGAIQRFQREAQLAARVKSPHLVGVLDVNQESGLTYLVMEYVAGVSAHGHLRDVVKTIAPSDSGRVGLHESVALDICIAACTGLAAAHAKGIIHRDVKPDNILIPRDENTGALQFHAAKLADLGLARSESLEQSSLTLKDAGMGTPGYMPPEQFTDAKSCRKPTDVFALGATLYALLSGAAPFAGTQLYAILKATIESPHKPILELRPDVSAPTAEVLDRCLAKDPAQRFVDAAALLAALKVCREALAKPEEARAAMARVSGLLGAAEVGQTVADTITPPTVGRDSDPVRRGSPSKAGTSAMPSKAGSESRPTFALALILVLLAGGAWTWYALLEKLGPTQKYLVLDLGGGVKMDLVLIPSGAFEMGSPAGEEGRYHNEKQHTVTISRDYYMAKYPVTQEQYAAVMNTNPSNFTADKGGGPKNPVEQVSWNDAVEFCEKLDSAVKAKLPRGMKLQLPTEAQWEYACRAGTKTRFYSGDADSDLDGVAWYSSNSDSKTHPVGLKTPNAFRLYDMHGNVWQWCRDVYRGDYENLVAKNPINKADGTARVLRGGAWSDNPRYCRSANRFPFTPDYRSTIIGCRIVVSLDY